MRRGQGRSPYSSVTPGVGPRAPDCPGRIRRRLVDNEICWRCWSSLHQSYAGLMRDLVHQSGVVLQVLTYAASGAVIAAVTTSLPEGIDSGRTWDYRYVWVRDASMTQQGLHVAACPKEAGRFFSRLRRRISPPFLPGAA